MEGMEECGEAEFFMSPGSDMMDWVRLEMMSLVLELVRICDWDMKLVISTSLELQTKCNVIKTTFTRVSAGPHLEWELFIRLRLMTGLLLLCPFILLLTGRFTLASLSTPWLLSCTITISKSVSSVSQGENGQHLF